MKSRNPCGRTHVRWGFVIVVKVCKYCFGDMLVSSNMSDEAFKYFISS